MPVYLEVILQGNGTVLNELIELGFSAVMNFPTVGLIDGRFRKELEDTGMGYGKEMDALK